MGTPRTSSLDLADLATLLSVEPTYLDRVSGTSASHDEVAVVLIASAHESGTLVIRHGRIGLVPKHATLTSGLHVSLGPNWFLGN